MISTSSNGYALMVQVTFPLRYHMLVGDAELISASWRLTNDTRIPWLTHQSAYAPIAVVVVVVVIFTIYFWFLVCQNDRQYRCCDCI